MQSHAGWIDDQGRVSAKFRNRFFRGRRDDLGGLQAVSLAIQLKLSSALGFDLNEMGTGDTQVDPNRADSGVEVINRAIGQNMRTNGGERGFKHRYIHLEETAIGH